MKYNKPVIIAGNGIRTSETIDKFKEFINTYKIPFVTSFLAKDILTDNPLNYGVMGIKGNYWANKITQDADLIICLGTRLARGMIGYSGELLNPKAYKVVVDIDKTEHSKDTVKIDLFLEEDLKKFDLNNVYIAESDLKPWIKQCNDWKEKFYIRYEDFHSGIDVYKFFDELCNHLKSDSVIVTDAGTSYFVAPQALRLKEGMRYITDGAQAAMGFALPASIGACFGNDKKEVICITGDGGLQFNLQELATIMYHKLPIKIFVLNNNGYMTIRNTADKFFDGRYIGTDSSCGISFPNLFKISQAYNIEYANLLRVTDLENVMKYKSPIIIEVYCDALQKLLPSY